MPNFPQTEEARLIASCAAEHLEHLEALFDAIRDHLERGTYARSLADLGQRIASSDSAEMARLAKPEDSHA
ncbi:hypothetical protein [Pandoraea soli]